MTQTVKVTSAIHLTRGTLCVAVTPYHSEREEGGGRGGNPFKAKEEPANQTKTDSDPEGMSDTG